MKKKHLFYTIKFSEMTNGHHIDISQYVNF